jgi:hypothetical protein
MVAVYFRIQIAQITGHHTAPEPGEAVEHKTAPVVPIVRTVALIRSARVIVRCWLS